MLVGEVESIPRLLAPSAIAGLALAHALNEEQHHGRGILLVYIFLITLVICLFSASTIRRIFLLPARSRQLRKLKSDMCEHVGKMDIDGVRESSVIAYEEDWPSPSSAINRPSWRDLTEERTKRLHQSIIDCCERDADTVKSEGLKDSLAYAFKAPGKMARSRLVLLMADIAAKVPPSFNKRTETATTDTNDRDRLEAKQELLAEVIECEHNASLLHDDVVDEAATRRGLPSHCCRYGNDQAVWTGDFIVSVMIGCLTRINNPQVTKCIAGSMQNLVKGELLQVQRKRHLPTDEDTMRMSLSTKPDEEGSTATTKCGSDSEIDDSNNSNRSSSSVLLKHLSRSSSTAEPDSSTSFDRFSEIALKCPQVEPHFQRYILKSFYKTASLFASAMESVAICADLPPALVSACYLFGVHFGLEFQIRDDMLDVEEEDDGLGKPKGADFVNGQATAPFLYACDDDPSLLALVERGFKGKSDPTVAMDALRKNPRALQRSKLLVKYHASKAIGCLLQLPDCDARQALIDLTSSYVARTS
ncbi:Decaprenyl-diphosphate synthase subunit 1 [Perkinsus chesapeaki]|uniref:Decaprenyl-diphosphate synthase subunit 1 n=1 Tax=Perkinsus chesapeaki TaxID=330153 RepID=A0A7J6MPY0_PERCH|nr:Decaprenyl-diphosphate synthase subunit 1 [Perkinsus chesapeaki]